MKRITTPDISTFETKHIDRVRALAPECMVLLKNDGTLPLGAPGKVALYGSGARQTIKGGTGSGDVNVRHFVNVEEGLENAGFEITSKAWLDAYDQAVLESKKAFFKDQRKQADAAGANPLMFVLGKVAPEPSCEFPLDGEGDTSIYVLARISGEGADRLPEPGDIKLTQEEIRDILALNRRYDRFVLVLNVGGMVDLTPVAEVGTVLLMGQLGTPAGDVLADVLTGKRYPSGKLAMTWAPIETYPSTKGFAEPDDTDYQEGIYVGYRYFDTVAADVTYPFGFGLSYTSFSLTPGSPYVDRQTVKVPVLVKNTGNRPGKEVVEVYCSAPDGTLEKPFQELAGFAKTGELQPGVEEMVTVSFDLRDMASYDPAAAAWVLEDGLYQLRAGSSSRETTIVGAVYLSERIVTEQLRNITTTDRFEDLSLPRQTEPMPDDAPILTADPAGIDTRHIAYIRESEPIPKLIKQLSDEELANLCLGNYKDAEDILEIIGNAAIHVAGAAGETTGWLNDYNLPHLVMADGPAGLRLSQEYTLEGEIASGAPAFGGDMMLVFEPEELAAMVPQEDPNAEKKESYYQYCVSVPIGTDIAQSWNRELAEEVGDLVGSEMERFGIHTWLAPAMNLQRSPLCGRNFEYYSEDPRLSGWTAAAVTKGIQKHPGCGATLKHFACNNQETNRFFSNSNLSERALRELYLKGFEIAVKEAEPHFIMTSYNLINGEHACNRKDLLTDVLRREWGFRGIVMTDWLVTGGMGSAGEKWPCASAAGNVKAGNDLTMPGMPSDKADILNALNDSNHAYALERADMERCAARILNKIYELTNV